MKKFKLIDGEWFDELGDFVGMEEPKYFGSNYYAVVDGAGLRAYIRFKPDGTVDRRTYLRPDVHEPPPGTTPELEIEGGGDSVLENERKDVIYSDGCTTNGVDSGRATNPTTKVVEGFNRRKRGKNFFRNTLTEKRLPESEFKEVMRGLGRKSGESRREKTKERDTEILFLRSEGISVRKIARHFQISNSSVQNVIKRAERA